MTNIATGAVNHFALTVTDKERSRDFYTKVLNFQMVVEFGPKFLLSNGSVLLALGPAPDENQAITDDRFDENRVGLDHISLSVASLDELEQAVKLFDEQGIAHGEIKDLGDFGIYVLAFRDPDNTQLELTAPKA
jgi:glyoxylase I family protein